MHTVSTINNNFHHIFTQGQKHSDNWFLKYFLGMLACFVVNPGIKMQTMGTQIIIRLKNLNKSDAQSTY